MPGPGPSRERDSPGPGTAGPRLEELAAAPEQPPPPSPSPPPPLPPAAGGGQAAGWGSGTRRAGGSQRERGWKGTSGRQSRKSQVPMPGRVFDQWSNTEGDGREGKGQAPRRRPAGGGGGIHQNLPSRRPAPLSALRDGGLFLGALLSVRFDRCGRGFGNFLGKKAFLAGSF